MNVGSKKTKGASNLFPILKKSIGIIKGNSIIMQIHFHKEFTCLENNEASRILIDSKYKILIYNLFQKIQYKKGLNSDVANKFREILLRKRKI